MTYREKFAVLRPERDAATAHMGNCPDGITGLVGGPFRCPNIGCAACWDRQIPEPAPKKEQPVTTCHIVRKGLAACAEFEPDRCIRCPYHGDGFLCSFKLCSDALAYIETLEERLKEAEANARNNNP